MGLTSGQALNLNISLPISKGSSLLVNSTIDYSNFIDKDRTMNLEQIEQPAVIMVQSAIDSTTKFVTNKFLLQSITKPRMERFQIVETFRNAHVYFFGERTKVYSITGELIEGLDSTDPDNDDGTRDQYRWSTSLQTLYDNYLRGSQLASAGNIAILIFEKMMLTGYPLQLQIQRSVSTPYMTNFQMTWAIYDEQFLDDTSDGLYQLSDVIKQQVGYLSNQIAALKDKLNKLEIQASKFLEPRNIKGSEVDLSNIDEFRDQLSTTDGITYETNFGNPLELIQNHINDLQEQIDNISIGVTTQ
jgi:hypothetical protein